MALPVRHNSSWNLQAASTPETCQALKIANGCEQQVFGFHKGDVGLYLTMGLW